MFDGEIHREEEKVRQKRKGGGRNPSPSILFFYNGFDRAYL
jgi:hypothetical protein